MSVDHGFGAQVLRRAMDVRLVGGLALLGAVRDASGTVRAFFANGTDRADFDPAPAPDVAVLTELREVSGGILLVTEGVDPLPVALVSGVERITPIPDERALFAGLNTALAFRLEEPADTVADWLAYHATHHGLQAAVIVDRAPPGDKASSFVHDLSTALDARGVSGVRIVVVDPGVPLGKPDMAPENHPWMAPDAPGKDRMTPPDPDPWRAPLGEGLMLELLKWWFLADARAVLLLDVTDLLVPAGKMGTDTGVETDGVNAFDACVAASGGVILLVGRRIYPWRVRQGRVAHFGDHICRQFDARRGIARWGVAPAKAGLDNTWRLIRVSYAKPDPGVVVPFWRAMAVRVPARASSELAPKTSLIEHPDLIALATGPLGWKPVRAPVSEAKRETSDRTAIVTTMKNEGPFILEWIAYHRAIGVQDFLVYTNDCTDGTDTMLDLLQAKGIVQHRVNPWVPGGELKPQHAALQAAESEPLIQNAGWAICMDVDEFINIKLGDGRLPTLFAAMETALPGANMISLTWRLFGNSDVDGYEDRFLLDQFDRCAPEVVRKPHQA
ncbi:MAG: glycosyltransferase family 2 protein, partial [Gemmobacter sp.]|nr:glycosyltransferase family 2 protein [Gemmobacter sp.]